MVGFEETYTVWAKEFCVNSGTANVVNPLLVEISSLTDESGFCGLLLS